MAEERRLGYINSMQTVQLQLCHPVASLATIKPPCTEIKAMNYSTL